MPQYVDGNVLPIRRDRPHDYQGVVESVADKLKDHGPLAYREFIGDDLKPQGTRSFAEVVAAAESDVIVFGWVEFASRVARDSVSAWAAVDPGMADLVDPSNSGCDARRIAYGGFRSFVQS